MLKLVKNKRPSKSKEVKKPTKSSKGQVIKFGFIVHPLSDQLLRKAPMLGSFDRYNKTVQVYIKKIVHKLPGFLFGKITGLKAKDGREVEGRIYAICDTPKMLLEADKEEVYQKLIQICRKAEKSGVQLMGLGAYTKVIGDKGVSVTERSPIPVTTGNSFSAGATLLSVEWGMKNLNFCPKVGGVYKGTALVIGASGSIGRVLALILASRFTKIILAAPNLKKLQKIKDEILEKHPKAHVICTQDNNQYLKEVDLIVTTTSAGDKKILDIMQVKSGCLICDVSRPFDISKEDALKRPDVLVIASGEVYLPNHANIHCDIGLEGSSVYACLAETAILAMDLNLTAYSLGDNLEADKVIEISKKAKKYKFKLTKPIGPLGPVTRKQINQLKKLVNGMVSVYVPETLGERSKDLFDVELR